MNFEGRVDAFIGKIKKKRNNEREVVRCAKSHNGIRQKVICLKIKVNAELLSWISLFFRSNTFVK